MNFTKTFSLVFALFLVQDMNAQSVGVLGKLAVGKDTANMATIDVLDTLMGRGMFVQQTVDAPISIGYWLESQANGGSQQTGFRANLTGNTPQKFGSYIRAFNSDSLADFQFGNWNDLTLNINSSDSIQRQNRGIFNDLTGSQNTYQAGVYNALTGTTFGRQRGVINLMNVTGDGENIGTYNFFDSQSAQGSGEHIGTKNTLRGSGLTYGVYNEMNGSGARQYGVYNKYSGFGNGVHVGIKNDIGSLSVDKQIGIENLLDGSFVDSMYGIRTIVSGSSGDKYGIESIISGSGSGKRIAGYFHAEGGTPADRYAAIFNDGHIVANESGGNNDFRIESENFSNMLFLDASEDRVGIGTGTPTKSLDVLGNALINYNSTSASPTLELKEVGSDYSRMSFTSSAQSSFWNVEARPNSNLNTAAFNVYNSINGNILTLLGDGDAIVKSRMIIGGTTPLATLHARASSDLVDPFRVQVINSTKFRVYGDGKISLGGNQDDGSAGDVFVLNQMGMGVNSPSYRLELSNSSNIALGQGLAFAWKTYSDERVKSNIDDLSYGLQEVLRLRPVSYHHHTSSFNENGLAVEDEYSESIGFIAQEVHQVIKEVVQKPDDEAENLWSMDYEKLTPVLVNAIQEQQKLIDQLIKEVNQLKQASANSLDR